MTLAPGTVIGSYEILSPLGAGGMGEVYRARDTRLERSVAIKSLPASFGGDVERRARFEREAKLLASLNHPNIAAIYGLVDADGASHLVLEFVDGETLAHRLARGPLTAADTLAIGVQIAAAVEAAHERGIVHRDLKPANVMLTTAGSVKVLDFGLAKNRVAGSSPALSASPTVAPNATAAGIILGTAAYMSPEQARGKEVDRPSDVWSFGCILYECLTGRAAFSGETVSDIIARILEREPEWSALPASTPTRLADVVRRCLTKDDAARPRDISDLRRELAAIAMGASSSGAVAAPRERPSLAVLYFENQAKDADSEYFCSGVTEDILTDLSKIKNLRVASRNAVARYRGEAIDIARVAAELGVGAVLEGSVRRSGDRVRITAQLVAADGFQMWAERYDRTLADVFAVQEEIASAIATALRVALSPAEAENLVSDRPADVHAYDLYLKGRASYGKYTAESLNGALELFRKATAIDPGYARAWAGIADCYGQMCQWGIADPQEVGPLGLEAARKAIQIDPGLAEAYKAEALVLRNIGDHAGSRASLVKAIEVNPRYTPALINMTVERFCRGDVAGAERFARRALEVDPQESFAAMWLAILCRLTDRGDETLAIMDRVRRISDDVFYVTGVHVMRAWVYLGRGELDAVRRTIDEGRADAAHVPNLQCVEAMLAARSGRGDTCRALLTELEPVGGLGGAPLMIAAGAAVRIGDLEVAGRFASRRLIVDLAPTAFRLDSELHALLDREPLAPRRRDATLVWPLEAPMIDAARFALFRDVRVESGRPEASGTSPG